MITKFKNFDDIFVIFINIPKKYTYNFNYYNKFNYDYYDDDNFEFDDEDYANNDNYNYNEFEFDDNYGRDF